MSEQIDDVAVETEEVEAAAVDSDVDTESLEADDAFDADKARDKIRKLNSEARNLRERAKASEEKALSLDEKEKTISTQVDEIQRLRFAVKHSLPEALVSRLKGSTEEELLADAETLMDLFGSKKPPTQVSKEKLRSPGGAGVPGTEEDVDAAVEAAFAR